MTMRAVVAKPEYEKEQGRRLCCEMEGCLSLVKRDESCLTTESVMLVISSILTRKKLVGNSSPTFL